MANPVTVALGNGYTESHLDPARDYVIRLPQGGKNGGVTLIGGHNIVIVGGQVTVPRFAGKTHIPDARRRGLYIKDATGTVHVEGVLFGAARGAVWDAIDIAAPDATVQLENVRIEGVRGSYEGFHADVVQPWGGVRKLRIDRLSASSGYQGLTIPIDAGPIGSARISHVDLHGIPGDPHRGRLLWLTSGSRTCRGYPVDLRDVYLETEGGHSLGSSVWPRPGQPADCGARLRKGHVSWPRLPEVSGFVESGLPPRGAYVPAGVAGVDYVSAWLAESR